MLGKAESRSLVFVDTVTKWVGGRFEVAEHREHDAATAVKKFLAYVCACGFIERSPTKLHGKSFYEVVHGGLTPPPKQSEPEREPAFKVRQAPDGPKTYIWDPLPPDQKEHKATAPEQKWKWQGGWVRQQERLAGASRLLTDSPHRLPILALLMSLEPSSRPEYPSELSRKLLLEHGVPEDVTLRIFRQLGMAIEV